MQRNTCVNAANAIIDRLHMVVEKHKTKRQWPHRYATPHWQPGPRQP